jgi:hypothetical protein
MPVVAVAMVTGVESRLGAGSVTLVAAVPAAGDCARAGALTKRRAAKAGKLEIEPNTK